MASHGLAIYSIGHSNHAIGAFIGMLQAHGVKAVVDVRTTPYSRFNRHYNQHALMQALLQAGIAYHHLPNLGGLRSHYTRYMRTDLFKRALTALMTIGAYTPTAFMCAEADPTTCHRFHISAALEKHGVTVEHIRSAEQREPHAQAHRARTGYTLELFA